jgi:hypothetical protein
MVAILTGLFFSYWSIALISLCLLFFSYKDYRNWSLFFISILAVVAYQVFALEPMDAAKCLAGYLPIGILWSFWRWKRHGDVTMKGIDPVSLNDNQRSVLIEKITPRYNIDLITGWVMAWPFSAISHIFSDLIALVSKIIREYFIEIYTKISGNHLEKLKAPRY